MIYSQVTAYDVTDRARSMGRIDQFGYTGWKALFEYLEELSDGTGENIELDIIALCCDFTRFDDIADYNEQYGTEHDAVHNIEGFACMIDDGPAFICHAH